MTVGDWLDSRLRLSPPLLADKVRESLDADLGRDAGELPELCVTKGEELLRDLLRKDPASRDRACELLLVDALITYAFEAAIENVQTLDARASHAIARLSALAEDPQR